ncbi:MAG: D-2-hydroxyacid dehydrogenase [Lachnospiraceae bacterium]|nr:D-2-hydroxyacid dehydrogenase [Lachnospiraceae bacterium]
MKILFTIPTEKWVEERFRSIAPEADFHFAAAEDIPDEELQSAEIIIGNVPPSRIKASPKLAFYQTNSAGSNNYTVPGVLADSTILCNATGSYGVALAEHMLAQLLLCVKKLDLYLANQKERIWRDEGEVRGLYASKTLIVGAGDIGTEFGKRMAAFGSRVSGIRRHKTEAPVWMEKSGSLEDLDAFLAEADYVACALPETPETRRLFTRERLARMKKGAILLNIGRGTLIDEEAVVEAAESGRLGAYITDVTDPEPLPEESPLWICPNVYITPHISGNYHLRETYLRVIDLAARNLEAYLKGGKLENIVDRETGYRRFEG